MMTRTFHSPSPGTAQTVRNYGRESRARRNAEAPAHAPDQERPWVLLSVFPWPEQFYEREEDLEPIASDLMVSLTSIIIFILCGAAFGYTYVFFSDPSQDTVDRIVSAQTAIDGYTCRPMGPDKWYDLNWTHAECKKKLRPLTAENIDWPEPGDCSGVPCNCPRGEKIVYRPFGTSAEWNCAKICRGTHAHRYH